MAKSASQIVDPPEILTKVKDRILLYEGYIADIEKKRAEWWRIYRGELEAPDPTYKEQSAVPYTTATINTIVPRMVQNDTKFRYVGETEQDELNAPNMSELANDQMRIDDLEITKIDGFTETLVLGTAFYKVPWVKETLEADYDQPLLTIAGKNIGKLRKTIKKTLFDGPQCEHILLNDFYFDPFGWNINGKDACDWVAHRKLINEADLVKKYGKEVLDKISESEANTEERAQKSQNEVILPKDKHKKPHELIEYWEDDRKVVVIDRSYVAEDGNNPFNDKKKPFLVTVDHKVPHQLLGIGEIEFLQGLQTLITNFVRQAADKQTQAEHNLLFLEKGSGLNKDQFNKQPFGIHTVDDLTKIKFEKLDGVDPMTMQIIEMLKTFHDSVSGTSDFSKGNGDGNLNDTATGIQLIQEAANFIFQVKIKLAKKMLMTGLANFLVSRNQQFLNKTVTVRVKDAAGADTYHEISKKDIQGNFIALIEETAPLNDSVKRSEALQLYRQFQGDNDVDQIELKRGVLEAFGKDVKKLMPGQDQVDLETQATITDAEREAESEDALMFAGKTISVAQTDDHEVHIIVHEEALTQTPDEAFTIVDNHIEEHKAFLSPRLSSMMGRSVMDNGISPQGIQPQLEMEMEEQYAQENQGPGNLPAGAGGTEGPTNSPGGPGKVG
jgi:hypothetical protein